MEIGSGASRQGNVTVTVANEINTNTDRKNKVKRANVKWKLNSKTEQLMTTLQ